VVLPAAIKPSAPPPPSCRVLAPSTSVAWLLYHIHSSDSSIAHSFLLGRPVLLLPVPPTRAVSFFRFGGGRPLHGVHLLPSRSWSAKFRFVVSLVPSWLISCLHLGVHPFQVPRTTMSLARTFPMEFSICRATFLRRVVLVLEVTSSLRG
jgi:hypothetical protein